jgi:uncharacterized lipoprotein YmbA
MLRPAIPLILAALLAACQSTAPEPQVRRDAAAEPALAATSGAACWATDRIPAQTGTLFEPVGTSGERQPREVTLRPAEDRMFAVPCADEMTADLIASLQRALAARGLHAGVVSGIWDAGTADAVRRYQAPQGLDSAVLSLQAAQQLGLIAVARGTP